MSLFSDLWELILYQFSMITSEVNLGSVFSLEAVGFLKTASNGIRLGAQSVLYSLNSQRFCLAWARGIFEI